ncbi:MAG: DUF3516 domain-containing protein, partial [Verrucomicrobiales bacterium]|nr:DUF3516 domain-containing protein [Verrucomicrobiales bacterium]
EWKQEGKEYHERMAELDLLEYPKPRRDFVYETFNAFADKHPWVGQENVRPKSIAREMFEDFRSFADYVKLYDLQRSEGLLLRHLNSVYKVLAQTVPDASKTDAVREMETYLGLMLRQVDSSLLQEWERMRDPGYRAPGEAPEIRPPGAEEAARDITRDTRAFTATLRVHVFAFLRAFANGDFEAALAALPHPSDFEDAPWTIQRLQECHEAFHRDHDRIRLDPDARNVRHTHVRADAERQTWRLDQMLVDPEDHNDWVAAWHVDIAGSRARQEPQFRLARIGPVAQG